MIVNEERASDFINTQERIDEVRQYTRDLMTTFEVDRKPGWWTTPMRRHTGKVVVPVEAIEDDIYHFFLLSNLFYTNEFEPGIARIAITELEFDLSQRFSKKFMLFKKIIEIIMTVDDEYLKYDNDLNGLSFEELREEYNDLILSEYNAMATRIEQRTYRKNKEYNIIKIESFEHAQMFYEYSNSYSPLCMTYSKFKYDSYTAYGNNAMYFVLYKDFKNIEEPDIDYDDLSNKNFSVKPASWIDYTQLLHDGCCMFPWDEYGLSLMVVIVNTDGTLNTCIGRYNHALGSYARDYLDEEQLSIAVGGNFYEVFKPNEVDFEEEIKESSSVAESLDMESDFSDEDYLHGDCQQWVINNYREGDKIIVLQEYDYDIDETCMGHSLIFRNGKYVDVRGEMDTMEEVFDEFDFTDDDMLEFETLDEFKEYLDEMEIPYSS